MKLNCQRKSQHPPPGTTSWRGGQSEIGPTQKEKQMENEGLANSIGKDQRERNPAVLGRHN